MTEDVLEQVVDDWLRRQGYFTRTNVRFGPGKDDEGYDSTAHNQQTDLDVLAIKPAAPPGPERVLAISCKAMQSGFSPNLSKSFMNQSPGTELRRLASEILD